jgi:hypothetical protein
MTEGADSQPGMRFGKRRGTSGRELFIGPAGECAMIVRRSSRWFDSPPNSFRVPREQNDDSSGEPALAALDR